MTTRQSDQPGRRPSAAASRSPGGPQREATAAPSGEASGEAGSAPPHSAAASTTGAAPSAPPASDPEFDANTLDLGPGIRLLEASAGTGKTFALAHLVLRLVSEAELPLRQLLVVTFTEAAAAELRDRISRRLQEGLALLESQVEVAGAVPPEPSATLADAREAGRDAVLIDWWRRCRSLPPERCERLRVRLLLALEELAAADITTIHGFCRRTLQREALAAGRSPQLELEDPDDPAIAELVHAYWQRQVLPLPPHLLAGLRRCKIHPAALQGLLRSLDTDPALSLDPLPADVSAELSLSEQLPQLWQRHWQRFTALWSTEGRHLQEELLEQARCWRADGFTKTDPYKPTARLDRCAEVEAFIAAQPPEGDYEACLEQRLLSGYFHPGSYCKVAREGERLAGRHSDRPLRLPHPALMQAVADLLDGPAEALLSHALHWGRRELERLRRRRGVSSFSQLLRDLDPGPDPAAASPLLDAVAGRYRAALIDEFQDTDPIQWRILRRAFASGEHLLVMVGDPKQAIYRFRGGDLNTYLSAAAHAHERWALTGNRRSTPGLIKALNQLMAPGLRRSALAVPQVQPHADRSGPAGAAIQLLWLEPPPDSAADQDQEPDQTPQPSADRDASPAAGPEETGRHPVRHPARTALERQLPEAVALLVEDLLRQDLTLVAGERARPLLASDICLLVSNHRQAEALRLGLERRGLPSRLVSRADVFLSPAGTALQRFLDALADPADANRLRLLAASPLLAWSADRIAAATAAAWGELADRLALAVRRLPQRGLLGVLADLLGAEGMARLERGGRLAADLQQVSTLVQQRLHTEGLAPAAAADWLRRRRLDPPQQLSEADQAHSDRVDGAVSVITIHRSKGLEFPVVICPYLWQAAASGRPDPLGRRWHPPAAVAPVLDLHRNLHWGPGWAAEQQRREEEEKERERLAYVALTRAQHRLVLAWGPAKGQQCAPLLPWLFPDQPLAPLEEDLLAEAAAPVWRQRLEAAIAGGHSPLQLIDPPPAAASEAWKPAAAVDTEALQTATVPSWPLGRSWSRSSYSSWVRGHAETGSGPLPPEALEEGRDTGDATPPELEDTAPAAAAASAGDAAALQAPVMPVDWARSGPLAEFPAGPLAGDCLHRILEHFSFDQPATAEPNRLMAEQELRRSGLAAEWLPALLEGLEQVRLTPFGSALGRLRLADLPSGGWLAEMRFDLSLGHAKAAGLAAAFRRWPGGAFGSAYGERLAQLPIGHRGFLTGAVDLIFPALDGDGQQRWWVLDWKSNRLAAAERQGQTRLCGPRQYAPEAMRQLMEANHYPLQAHLYLVALHRYLRWRLPDYAPERHLGGYVYVFLRGTPGEAGSRVLPGAVPGMLVDVPPLQRLLALDAALGGGADPDATSLEEAR